MKFPVQKVRSGLGSLFHFDACVQLQVYPKESEEEEESIIYTKPVLFQSGLYE